MSATALILGCLFVATASAQDALQRDIPELLKAYPIAAQPADFIVAIDRSGSMKGFWPDIQRQLGTFVEALPEGDFLSIIGFADRADDLLIPRKLDQEARRALQTELAALPVPTGQRTDLAAGASACLESLNRPGGPGFAFVFAFTDFKHEPPAGSPAKEVSIRSLEKKHDAFVIRTDRFVKVYALQLPLESGAGRDLDIFQAAFGGRVTKVVLTRAGLAAWFESVRATFNREKVKAIAERDLRTPVAIEGGSIRNGQLEITLVNRSRLSLNVQPFEVRAAGMQIPLPASDEILPGGKQTFRVLLQRRWLDRVLPERTTMVNVQPLEMEITIRLDAELAKLGLSSRLKRTVSPGNIEAVTGTPLWILIGIGALILGAIFAAWRYWGRSEVPFSGRRIQVTLFRDNVRVGSEKEYSAGSNVIQVSTSDFHTPGDAGTPAVAVLVFSGRRPKLFRTEPKRGTYLHVQSDKPLTFKLVAAGDGSDDPIVFTAGGEPERIPDLDSFTLQCRYSAPGGVQRSISVLVSQT